MCEACEQKPTQLWTYGLNGVHQSKDTVCLFEGLSATDGDPLDAFEIANPPSEIFWIHEIDAFVRMRVRAVATVTSDGAPLYPHHSTHAWSIRPAAREGLRDVEEHFRAQSNHSRSSNTLSPLLLPLMLRVRVLLPIWWSRSKMNRLIGLTIFCSMMLIKPRPPCPTFPCPTRD